MFISTLDGSALHTRFIVDLHVDKEYIDGKAMYSVMAKTPINGHYILTQDPHREVCQDYLDNLYIMINRRRGV